MLLLVFLLGNVQAQSAGTNPYHKPQSDLSKSKLSSSDVLAYQKRAVQKVEEFYQYLKAMADTKHKDEVRDKALQMAKRQFDPEARIKVGEKESSLIEYLEQCRKGSSYKVVDTMYIIQPLVLTEKGRYEGKIEVKYHDQDAKKSIKNTSVKTEEVSLVLKRRKKKFGDVSRLIWELYLNDLSL